MTLQPGTREHTIGDYLGVVRRYKWIIIVAALVVPTVAYFMSSRSPKIYQASADVLLNRQDLGATITGLPTQSTATDPYRYALTQERLAEASAVSDRALEIAGLENLEGWGSDVSADPDTDILSFNVTHGDPDIATRLANAYAKAFTQYKLETDTASLTRARTEIQGRLETDRQLDPHENAWLEHLRTVRGEVDPELRGGSHGPRKRRRAALVEHAERVDEDG